MRKKILITYSNERVVLSDVLPYETPLIFSNRYFYNYLLKRRKSISNRKFRNSKNKAFSIIEDILFSSGIKNSPFIFNINHKVNDYRELNIIHPKNQVLVSDFYKKYESLILYYCTVSPFSIRKPASVAKFTFYNDLLHKKNIDGDLEHSQIEQDESEYENLKSYFTYQKYSNIHKFFESYQFHRCEKKYNKLLKIDISKCFDSIYTHTISWAIFNKTIIKDNIDPSLNTFAGEFDRLMQSLNANETNGIVIGPEFSRIFAELILQQIDRNIYERLKIEDQDCNSLIHKVDYEIFRYVDDFFIFYNNENDIERILKEFKFCLKEYKMYINDNKSIIYDKPIITEISLAKQKISDLFHDHLKLKEKSISINEENTGNVASLNTVYFSSNNVITRFKSIVKETNVEYKDIMNYSLAVLDKRTAKLIENIDLENKNEKFQKEFEKGFLEILDVAFFLYSVSPRVNSTIKLCLIIDKIICFLKKNKTNGYSEPFLPQNKHNVLKKISDEIYLILQKNKTKKETQIETLYLLIALSQLGREYRLNPKVLSSYFNIKIHSSGIIEFSNKLNYFSITVLLFYLKDIEVYRDIKDKLKEHIIEKFKQAVFNSNWKSDTELILLLMDVLSCPYLNDKIENNDKNKLLHDLDRFHTSIIQPINNLENYLKDTKTALLEIYKNKSLGVMDKRVFQKISHCFNAYKDELQKDDGFNVYKYEENLVDSIMGLKNNFNKKVNKYKFKKELLNLISINSNQVNLIEQEKFWFTKWTEFDFRMELQAKRSQEVY
ncbi:antiviral reverse transcriptase Drt3b [Flavobacterium sp. UBA4854]|uniref:antiviral reverse transcriptase Drt3b n=1 Tax=Flavobacterium sp. UBA4854 TaxID=1946548 RepID=UPI00257FC97D|nr:antiviral reverse transcriptase Drt3b [Flavobacterium sp. UBA4854]